ncbi:uncharacterized protein MKZ38_006852 [Zalerion maritima]|uniref:Uncharacterized protein n=1 Tax=Zalerion maritima TaxID=339359 RepID=A0AAD5WPJ6_9PEZI|nr:uncharacterized protein MKZ38_006852 [Zalerion maritima]
MASTAPPPDPSSSYVPPNQQRDRTMSLGDNALAAQPSSSGGAESAAASSNGASSGPGAGAPAAKQPAPSERSDVSKEVEEVLMSDYGITTMLNRLKQSVASAKEFALFLKKRSQLEEEHANGMKKLCQMSNNTMRRPEHRQGTWAQAYEDTMIIHERMCDNSLQFSASLHHMQEDLIEMAAIAEKSRKGWKQNGLTAEQRIQELDAMMRKSKAKYDSLAEEYDRVRTGDARPGGKGFFKSAKSAAQQEEDLLRKVQAADQDYRSRIDALRNERSAVKSSTRPDAVKALQDLARECDAGLALQMQKFASFNEKLLLSNGLTISPMKTHGAMPHPSGVQKSLKDIAGSVNNEKDANDFIVAQYMMMPPRTPELKYERNPVLNPQPSSVSMYPGQSQGQHPVQHPGTPMGQQPMGQQSMGQQSMVPIGGPQQHQQMPKPGGSMMPAQSMRPGMGGPGMGVGSVQSPGGAPSSGSPIGGQGPMGPPSSSHGYGHGAMQPMPGIPHQLPGSSSQPQAGPPQQHERSFSQGSILSQNRPSTQQQYPSRNSAGPGPRFNGTPMGGSQGPPQLGSLPFQTAGQSQSTRPQPQPAQGSFQGQGQQQSPPPQQLLGQQQRAPSAQHPSPPPQGMGQPHQPLTSNPQAGPPSAQAAARSVSPPSTQMSPPSRPVFGVSLEKLYERDGVPVPMIVYRCIQAIDLYGLNVEGIYRLSSSQTQIQRLRALFDTAGADGNAPDTDFRNPENFFHDVNSVAGLLKQFFRDLPDPLLGKAMHNDFIEAAKQEDAIIRRDLLHAIINSLPDPNYATLKALALHLYRVMDNSAVNRMSSQNLAIVFGPTLLGSSPDAGNIADAAWHSRVIDTILQNTYQIFDED